MLELLSLARMSGVRILEVADAEERRMFRPTAELRNAVGQERE
jgi:hypothetical protein